MQNCRAVSMFVLHCGTRKGYFNCDILYVNVARRKDA
jgi:hypothetical protein